MFYGRLDFEACAVKLVEIVVKCDLLKNMHNHNKIIIMIITLIKTTK